MDHRISSYVGHNRLVTVILRNLEYYEGILFLTTNRAAEFDEAVLSRIHLKIKYGEHPKSARREIWAFFLSKANTHQGPAIVSDAELRRLESLTLNGRDVSNARRLALISTYTIRSKTSHPRHTHWPVTLVSKSAMTICKQLRRSMKILERIWT